MMRWIEQLDAEGDVVRVLCDNTSYLARVVVHRDRTWRAEIRRRAPSVPSWEPLRGQPRGRYKTRVVRCWRSPVAAMQVVENLFAGLPKGSEPR